MTADLSARLAKLEALEELRRLKARYVAAVDGRDWDTFTSLFTDDCTFASTASLEGVDDLVDFVTHVRRAVEPGRSVHVAHLPDLVVVDDRHALGSWQMYDRVELTDGRPGWAGFGTYREEYRRGVDEAWRISAWRLDRSLVQRLSP